MGGGRPSRRDCKVARIILRLEYILGGLEIGTRPAHPMQLMGARNIWGGGAPVGIGKFHA